MAIQTIRDKWSRYKRSKGHGIHSPFAYHFITQVLRENLSYYIYPSLDNIAYEFNNYSASYCRMIFRIANYHRPVSVIHLSNSFQPTACALIAVNNCVEKNLWLNKNNITDRAKSFLSEYEYKLLINTEDESFHHLLKNKHSIGLMYIGDTRCYEAIIELSLGCVDDNSMIIFEGIHKSEDRQRVWKNLISDTRVGVTIDMKTCGIMFFNSGMYKQHYDI